MRGGATSARLGASVIDRYERRTKTGNKLGVIQLSDPSGQYEAIIFQEGLGQYRDLLERGADVLVTLQANVEGEDVRARIIQVESLTEAAAKVQKGLRVFVRDEAPLASIAERLRGRGEGEVSLIVMLGPKRGRGRDQAARPLRRDRRARRRAEGGGRRGGGGAGVIPFAFAGEEPAPGRRPGGGRAKPGRMRADGASFASSGVKFCQVTSSFVKFCQGLSSFCLTTPGCNFKDLARQGLTIDGRPKPPNSAASFPLTAKAFCMQPDPPSWPGLTRPSRQNRSADQQVRFSAGRLRRRVAAWMAGSSPAMTQEATPINSNSL